MLGQKIKLLRTENGLYQQDLADILQVSKSTVAMWETNKREPDLVMISKIASYFGVTVDWLTGKSPFRSLQNATEFYEDWTCNSDADFDPPFDFCPLIEKERIQRNISEEDVAASIGVSVHEYNEMAKGNIPITFKHSEKMCAVLGTNTSQLAYEKGCYNGDVPEKWRDNVRGWEKVSVFLDDNHSGLINKGVNERLWDINAQIFTEQMEQSDKMLMEYLQDYFADEEQTIAFELIKDLPRLNKEGLLEAKKRIDELSRLEEYENDILKECK